jgi:DNA-binding response OmpR family regulator
MQAEQERLAARQEKTPFIMVTGESRSENVIAAKKAGVSGYIVKPFNAQMLKAKIEAVFAARTTQLAERKATSVSQCPQSSEAAGPTPASDTFQLVFPGRFTSSS